ncbi:MAG TPA: hypothetical protein DCZ91_13890 [Lachnospiraceae bacterium]|nr:hypothetical protein [Lachnospiraceae bacterium]
MEPLSTRILNWLLRAGWLRKVEDYAAMTVYIVIPDYAAAFVDAFAHLAGEDEEESQVYIQNVYGILFAFKNDPRSNISLLKAGFCGGACARGRDGGAFRGGNPAPEPDSKPLQPEAD